MSGRIAWPDVIERAGEIVDGYDTSVTLRQLFYRLVAAQVIPNSEAAYKGLSARTAEARRAGTFPDLIDRGRRIHRPASFDSPDDGMGTLIELYRLDRTRDQAVSLFLGVEKAGLVVQLEAWFGQLGIPILALGGYSSQTLVDDVVRDVQRQDRSAILLYGGDFDATGEDIDRDFIERTGCWDRVVRVALTAEQVREHRLPVNPGKAADSRASGFVERHGELVQVELDALPPETLRDLFRGAMDPYVDESAYERVLADEGVDLELLEAARRLTAEDES